MKNEPKLIDPSNLERLSVLDVTGTDGEIIEQAHVGTSNAPPSSNKDSEGSAKEEIEEEVASLNETVEYTSSDTVSSHPSDPPTNLLPTPMNDTFRDNPVEIDELGIMHVSIYVEIY